MEDVAYRALAAQARPDHTTFARFVERHQDALAGVFGSVLGLEEPDSLLRLRSLQHAMLPDAELPDLLLEIAARTLLPRVLSLRRDSRRAR